MSQGNGLRGQPPRLQKGNVIFLGAHQARASSVRAARRTKRSAVTPADFARSDDSTADHHSSGIRSLWDHLRVEWMDAPISDAMASADGQSAMMSRNEVGSNIESHLRQIVLSRKANLSNDCGKRQDLIRGMDTGTDEPLSKTVTDLIERTRQARIASGLSQAEVARLMGMEQSAYGKYEFRSPIQPEHVDLFCLAVRIDPNWLFTGKGKGPAQGVTVEPRKPRAKRATKSEH